MSRHEPPSWFADRASRPAMSSELVNRSADCVEGSQRLVARRKLWRQLGDLRGVPSAELSFHEPAEVDGHRDAADDRCLAERAPALGVDGDPRSRVGAGHRSNGGTRCTVVQLCGGLMALALVRAMRLAVALGGDRAAAETDRGAGAT